MSGLITPENAAAAAAHMAAQRPPTELEVMVNINDQPVPLAVAKLLVLNDINEKLSQLLELLTPRTVNTGPK